MKVHIHFKFLKSGWGGSNSFMYTLARYLAGQPGIEVISSSADPADIVLLTGWSTGKNWVKPGVVRAIREYGSSSWVNRLLRRRSRPPKIVHRLDGIGYLYGRSDRIGDDLQSEVNRLSDRSIVQSRYSEALFAREGFQLTPATVISNGADSSLFFPDASSTRRIEGTLTLGAVSWSSNPRKGHADIARFSKVPGVKVRFIGNWPRPVDPLAVEQRPAVAFSQLGDFYRSCDALLFPAQGESCPNVVVETLACGVPVIYHPSGGTPELTEGYGVPMNAESPESTIDALRSQYRQFKERLAADRRRFTIERAGQEYLDLFRSLL